MLDIYAGKEQDSGFKLTLLCLICEEPHRVVLNEEGRWLYKCGGRSCSGQVDSTQLVQAILES